MVEIRRHRIQGWIGVLFAGLAGAALAVWTNQAEAHAHYTPDYEPVNLTDYLEKEKLSDEEYALLFCQTGLSGCGLEELWKEGKQEEILFLQERFFREVEMDCEANTIVTKQELLKEGIASGAGDKEFCFPTLENGDIMVTFNCHFLGWRSGHAGIVVDAEEGLVLEAQALGSNSAVLPLNHWEQYPSVAVLRLKDAAQEERGKIAAYAEEHLLNLPYRLSAGLITEGEGTQCAHLVWCAYEHFGYDVDGDGGRIVTPHDLYESDLLEIVQIYGINPHNCLKNP